MVTCVYQPEVAHDARAVCKWILRGASLAGFSLVICIGSLCALIIRLTEPGPRRIPVEPLSREESDLVEDRVLAFQHALHQQMQPPPLVLSTREFNGMLAFHPGLKSVRGRLRVNLDAETPEVQVSFRLKELNLAIFGHRWFNGFIKFTLDMRKGLLAIHACEIRANGHAVPGWLMEFIGLKNLAGVVNEDARFELALEKIETISAGAGRLIITPKAVEL